MVYYKYEFITLRFNDQYLACLTNLPQEQLHLFNVDWYIQKDDMLYFVQGTKY